MRTTARAPFDELTPEISSAALGEPEGIVMTICDDNTGELLGAHMVGAEVTEMIQV